MGEEVLKKLRALSLTSWNFTGHDPEKFRHYGPMAQKFFAAFGNDGIGTIGTPTTINSGDMAGILMIAENGLCLRLVSGRSLALVVQHPPMIYTASLREIQQVQRQTARGRFLAGKPC
jgi:hypothetical protein